MRSEELGIKVSPAAMNYFSDFFALWSRAACCCPAFFMGKKTADKLFACQPFLY